MEQIQSFWFNWGSLIALVVALAAVFGVFVDAYRKGVNATTAKLLTILAVALILPSIFLSLFTTFQTQFASILLLLTMLGIAATGVALIALVFSLARARAGRDRRCKYCGKPRDPTWPYCPYCEYDKPAAAPLPVTAHDQPPTPISPPRGETVALDAEGNLIPGAPPVAQTRILKATPEVLAYLVLRTGAHQGKTFQLSDATLLGREAAVNDIVLDDDSVSRQHARIRLEDAKFTLTDLGSSNGTFIQDSQTGGWKKIQQRQLINGMTIKLGESIMTFMQVETDKEG